ISFTNAMRSGNPSAPFFRSAGEGSDRLWLDLAYNGQPGNQILVGYTAQATNGFDAGLDGKYLPEGNGISSIEDTVRYAIQARQAFVSTDMVPLALHAVTAGSFMLSVSHTDGIFGEGQPIFLEDQLTGLVHDLAMPYSFTSEAGDFNDRLRIRYYDTSLGTGLLQSEALFSVYKQNGTLVVEGGKTPIQKVRLFDVRGRLLYERKAIGAPQAVLSDFRAEYQVILVEAELASGQVSVRKIVY
ncbi:MAG TPA: hypothetical protein VK183_13790, partial [Flavobacterium sp.]|nr:hypothetical protein [Flavobacterium sp.]